MKKEHIELMVHPFLARKVANHVSKTMLDGRRYRQVYPGVFAHPDGDKAVIVVFGAAPVSEPAVKALRKCKYLEQFIALQNPQGKPSFSLPRSRYSDDGWADEIVNNLARTRDVNSVMSVFEVMVAKDPYAIANLASASQMIAAQLPFDPDPVDNDAFCLTLQREMDRLVEEEEIA